MATLLSQLNERKVQDSLWLELRQKGHELIVPNYTPLEWWECDMFSVTKAGRTIEFEIKLTTADFRADSKKEKDRLYNWNLGGSSKNTCGNKHDLLTSRCKTGPGRFYYVAPEGIIPPDELPEFAGLFTITTRTYTRYEVIAFQETKKAPTLHTEAISEKVRMHAQGIFYWRYWNLRRELTRSQREQIL